MTRVLVATRLVGAIATACSVLAAMAAPAQTRSVRVEVTTRAGLIDKPVSGRLLVVALPVGRDRAVEPRRRIGSVGADAAPIAGLDVERFTGRHTLALDETAPAFPVGSLAALPPGEYDVQAVLDISRDLRLIDAPGNLHSRPQRLTVEPDRPIAVRLELSERVAPAPPSDTDDVRYIRLRSAKLSEFHGRPFFLRAAVILPRDFGTDPDRRFPLRVSIGGYGQRYTLAGWMMREGSAFRRAWLDPDAPQMLRVILDGAGPYGDPYQVNSANNGPYGDAVVEELIPYVENRFRGRAEPASRVVDGVSTGGWTALALQIFYPDTFNGAWSFCPDSVDFRSFQLVNIYDDDDAYVSATGERPSRRRVDGSVRYTMRHELAMENVLGWHNSWTTSGRQWGAWNAVYGPRGDDDRPVPLWDPVSGRINLSVARMWERYDLRLVLERNWSRLAPKLDGKLRIWVGEMDDYYLNEAVRRLDDFLADIDPSFRVTIEYGPGEGHCWVPHTPGDLLDEMAVVVGATP